MTGVELILWRASDCLGQRALDRPQIGLGGADSDWVVVETLPRNLWKTSYRSGRIFFVAADKAYLGFLDSQVESTLYVEQDHPPRRSKLSRASDMTAPKDPPILRTVRIVYNFVGVL